MEGGGMGDGMVRGCKGVGGRNGGGVGYYLYISLIKNINSTYLGILRNLYITEVVYKSVSWNGIEQYLLFGIYSYLYFFVWRLHKENKFKKKENHSFSYSLLRITLKRLYK